MTTIKSPVAKKLAQAGIVLTAPVWGALYSLGWISVGAIDALISPSRPGFVHNNNPFVTFESENDHRGDNLIGAPDYGYKKVMYNTGYCLGAMPGVATALTWKSLASLGVAAGRSVEGVIKAPYYAWKNEFGYGHSGWTGDVFGEEKGNFVDIGTEIALIPTAPVYGVSTLVAKIFRTARDSVH
jgi:hypothetical protein